MRKTLLIVIIIQLSSLSLFAGGLLTEVCRIPLLIEHFEDHERKNEKISFLTFLNEHYAQSDTNDSEHDELPFKSQIHTSSILLAIDFKNRQPEPVEFIEVKSFVFPSSIGNVANTSIAVFQPPQ
ncbi:MAG: hypothetical protein RLZZ155_249 [Bacteroidota bacterium]|jgi:hypothetical protein